MVYSIDELPKMIEEGAHCCCRFVLDFALVGQKSDFRLSIIKLRSYDNSYYNKRYVQKRTQDNSRTLDNCLVKAGKYDVTYSV